MSDQGGDGRGVPVADAEFLLRVVENSLKRARRWPLPPNWARTDWEEEVEAEGNYRACEAVRDFDPDRGVALGQFVYWRVRAGVLAYYRREWARGRRTIGLAAAEAVVDPGAADGPAEALMRTLVREAVARRPEAEQWLMEQLFGQDRTETDVAGELGMRRQSINGRKCNALAGLRLELDGPEQPALAGAAYPA